MMDLDLENFQKSVFTESCAKEHKILCGDRVFHVNGHFLAEQSPYFEKLFFGSFEESKTKTLILYTDGGIAPDHVLEYLSVLYGRKNIEAGTCAVLLRLSDMWETPSIKEKCRIFLQSDEWLQMKEKDDFCIDILEASISHGLRDATWNIVKFVANFTIERLEKERFFERIIDGRALFVIALKHGASQSSGSVHYKHTMQQNARVLIRDRYFNCSFCGSGTEQICSKCGMELCDSCGTEYQCDESSPNLPSHDESILLMKVKVRLSQIRPRVAELRRAERERRRVELEHIINRNIDDDPSDGPENLLAAPVLTGTADQFVTDDQPLSEVYDADSDENGDIMGRGVEDPDPDPSGSEDGSSGDESSSSSSDDDTPAPGYNVSARFTPTTDEQLACAAIYSGFKGHTDSRMKEFFAAGRYLFSGAKLFSKKKLMAYHQKLLEPLGLQTIFYCQACDEELANSIAPCETPQCSLYHKPHKLTSSAPYSICLANIEPQLEAAILSHWESLVSSRVLIRSAKDNFPYDVDLTERFSYPRFADPIESEDEFEDHILRLTLTINFDGLHAYNMSTKSWPVYLGVNDIPRTSADLIKSMIISAILFIPSGLPNLKQCNRLTGLLRLQMELLGNQGLEITVYGTTWKIYFTLVNFSVDLQAEVLFFNKWGWQSDAGCPDCTDGTEQIDGIRKWKITLPDGEELNSRPPMTEADAIAGLNGFKLVPLGEDPPALLAICSPQLVNADALHCVWHGDAKYKTIDCYGAGGKTAFFKMNDDTKRCLREMESLLKYPQSETNPGSFTRHAHMTASEIETFFLSVHLVACVEVGCNPQGAALLMLYATLLLLYLKIDLKPADFVKIEDLTKSIRRHWNDVCGHARNTFKAHRLMHHTTQKMFEFGSIFLNTATRWEKANRWLSANFADTDTRGPFRLFIEKFVLKNLLRAELYKLDANLPLVKQLFRDLGLGNVKRPISSKVDRVKVPRNILDIIEEQNPNDYWLYARFKKDIYTYSSSQFSTHETVGDSSFALAYVDGEFVFLKIYVFVRFIDGAIFLVAQVLRRKGTYDKLLDRLSSSRSQLSADLASLLREYSPVLYSQFAMIEDPVYAPYKLICSSALRSSAIFLPFKDNFYIASFHRVRMHT